MEDKKRPSDAPADGATVTASAEGVPVMPPTMPAEVVGVTPGGIPPLPPTMPPEPAARRPVSSLPPTMPGTSYPKMPGTVQMPFGATPGEEAAPIMATLTGAAVPDTGPPPMPPPDRYQLGLEIARGGMGRVMEATDTMLGRVVALKEVLSMDPDVLRRFARETRITARLEHPSIVPLHDAGTTGGGAPFYVMRKISGRPLEHLVAQAETLNQRLVLIPHIVAAAQAVAHAHERGIVHRDIKPSNILVGELGETIVIDWGLAKVIGEADEPARADLSESMTAIAPLATGAAASKTGGRESVDTDEIKTRAGIVFGTPGFMAPEQLRGHPVTERCDVYALGATLYHLLSRKPPHYAKTADEMMKAAARHPPTPIAALVPGVPAELSTIIEKALAHDPEQRYPDARSLAEDLQRFLSGQLVASHYYSPRERFVRFVRRNRVPVIIAASASLALLVGGTIAVTRVIGERDRADAHARIAENQRRVAEAAHDEAVKRADRLTLTQARVEVELNPTRAIAMVKPLAEKYPTEVRTIAAAARAHGVAHGLPASKQTSSLELSRDGARALAAGTDGIVRVYDLPKRTWQTLPATLGGEVRARFADEERRIVAWREQKLEVIDAATGAVKAVTAPTKIADLEVVGITAYWVDERRKLWQLDLAGGTPTAVPLPEPVEQVAPSPDGRFLALFGAEHLLLLDRTQPAEPPAEITIGTTRAFDWSTDGTGFGALVDDYAILGSTEGGPHIVQRNHVGGRFYVAHGNDRIYTLGPTGVGMVTRDGIEPRKPIDGLPVGLREARGGAIVAGSSGRIVLLSSFGDRSLPLPAGKLELLEAHPRSPYVVGAVEDRLLVWNLDDIEPRRIARKPAGPMLLLGSTHVLASDPDSGTQSIELASGRAVSLGQWPLHSAFISPSGHMACAIDLGHRVRLLVPGREPTLLDGQFDVAGFATDHALLLGTGASGTVQLHDPRSGKTATLVASRGKLLDLAWSRTEPAWAAGLFGDHSLWRRNLATGAEATTPNVTTTVHIQVIRNGTVLFAEDRKLRAWRPNGNVDTHAELPRRIVSIGLAGGGHLLAVLDDDTAWLVDLAVPNRIDETESIGSTARVREEEEEEEEEEGKKDDDTVPLSMSPDTGMLAIPHNGGVNIVDAIGRYTWTLAVQPPSANLYSPSTTIYADPRISADGTRVIARLPDGIVMWSIPVPGTGAETAKWVESLTNAGIDAQRSHKLIWR